MTFDDTARFFGPDQKLPPQLVSAYSQTGISPGQFNCPMCGTPTPMAWGPAMQAMNGRLVSVKDRNGLVFEQWNCLSCGFFYKPLVAGRIPKQYQAKLSEPLQPVTRLCLDCRRVVVSGIKRYCAKCVSVRQRKAKRDSARKRRSNVDKTGNSPLRVELITNAELAGRCSHPIWMSVKLEGHGS